MSFSEFLLNKSEIVHGVKRRASLINTDRIDHLFEDPKHQNINIFLHHGDMTDFLSLININQKIVHSQLKSIIC